MNATVNVSLESLDKLRDEKKQLEEQVKHYQATEKQIKIVYVEEYVKFKDNYIPNLYMEGRYRPGNMVTREYKGYIEQKPVYINFEEIEHEFKAKAEHNVIEKLGEKDRTILSLKKEIEDLKTTYKDNLINIRKNYQSEIAPQFEYNRYMRAFLSDNPNLSSKDAMKFWKLKRAKRGTYAYEKTDLNLK